MYVFTYLSTHATGECVLMDRPHVVILDEPTNHLDVEAINSLSAALRFFKGGVLVISHDQYFIKLVCNEIWVIKDKKVEIFNGTFEDYKNMTVRSL